MNDGHLRIHPWFRAASWEDEGRFYARLGIRRFRPFVAGGGFWQRRGLAARAWRRGNVHGYVRQSILAEVAHSLSFVFMAAVAALFLVRGAWLDAVAVTLLNLVLNLLPVAVARYNRLRILRHCGRGGARAS